MIQDLVARFVREQLMPLESSALAREASTGVLALLPEEQERLPPPLRGPGPGGAGGAGREGGPPPPGGGAGGGGGAPPAEMDGHDLPVVAMVGVNEDLGKTITPYDLPPDSPNLRMLMQTANASQRERYPMGPFQVTDLVGGDIG